MCNWKKTILQIGLIAGFGVFFSCGNSGEQQANQQKKKKQKNALSIIRNDDCLNCHNIQDKTVGPPYQEIAKRYDTNNENIKALSDKIINGGGGIWGGAQMSKHPFLKSRDASKIVRWILSLDSEEVLRLTQIPSLSIQNLKRNPIEKGITFRFFSTEEHNFSGNLPDVDDNAPTLEQLFVPKIHFKKTANFSPISEDFYLIAKGKLKIEKDGKYFLRLQKSGKGELSINDRIVISDSEEDQEIVLDLTKGTHPFSLKYLSGGNEELLSFQWIIPGEEYYSVISEEYFE